MRGHSSRSSPPSGPQKLNRGILEAGGVTLVELSDPERAWG